MFELALKGWDDINTAMLSAAVIGKTWVDNSALKEKKDVGAGVGGCVGIPDQWTMMGQLILMREQLLR